MVVHTQDNLLLGFELGPVRILLAVARTEMVVVAAGPEMSC